MNNQRATKKQQELLQFVDEFIREHGYGPSYREIMAGLGYKSVSTVAAHVDGLITKGFLNRRDNSPRSLEVATMSTPLAFAEVKSSTVVSEVTERLKKVTEHTERDTLLKALDSLGYETARKQLEKEHEATKT